VPAVPPHHFVFETSYLPHKRILGTRQTTAHNTHRQIIIIMKLTLSLAFLAATAHGFSPAAFGVRRSTLLQSTARPDSSVLIQDALAASKKFGAASSEARLAWEAVEEVDSSDNR
jgi:hypothetical protein